MGSALCRLSKTSDEPMLALVPPLEQLVTSALLHRVHGALLARARVRLRRPAARGAHRVGGFGVARRSPGHRGLGSRSYPWVLDGQRDLAARAASSVVAAERHRAGVRIADRARADDGVPAAADDFGADELRFVARDLTGTSNLAVVPSQVVEAPDASNITSTPQVTSVLEGDEFAYDAMANDPDQGQAVIWTLPLAPQGASVSASGQVRLDEAPMGSRLDPTGDFSYRPTAPHGALNVTARAFDPRGAFVLRTFAPSTRSR